MDQLRSDIWVVGLDVDIGRVPFGGQTGTFQQIFDNFCVLSELSQIRLIFIDVST